MRSSLASLSETETDLKWTRRKMWGRNLTDSKDLGASLCCCFPAQPAGNKNSPEFVSDALKWWGFRCWDHLVLRVKVPQKAGFKMRQSEWEMEKRKKGTGVGGVWPLAFLLISSSYFHSFGSSPPHFSLSCSCTCPLPTMFPHYIVFFKPQLLRRRQSEDKNHWATSRWNALLPTCTWIKTTYPDSCPCHQNTLSLHFQWTRTVKSAISCMALNPVAIW